MGEFFEVVFFCIVCFMMDNFLIKGGCYLGDFYGFFLKGCVMYILVNWCIVMCWFICFCMGGFVWGVYGIFGLVN